MIPDAGTLLARYPRRRYPTRHAIVSALVEFGGSAMTDEIIRKVWHAYACRGDVAYRKAALNLQVNLSLIRAELRAEWPAVEWLVTRRDESGRQWVYLAVVLEAEGAA